MEITYPFTITRQEGRYLVQFLDIAEAYTEGSTEEEAAFNAQEVLSLVLEQRLADGVEIPRPSPDTGCPRVAPDAAIQEATRAQWAATAEVRGDPRRG
jgi:antitoxin HicB